MKKMGRNKKEKRCIYCKRIIIGDSKMGLCPDCFAKAKATVAGGAITTVALAITIIQNKDNIAGIIDKFQKK